MKTIKVTKIIKKLAKAHFDTIEFGLFEFHLTKSNQKFTYFIDCLRADCENCFCDKLSMDEVKYSFDFEDCGTLNIYKILGIIVKIFLEKF